MRVQVQAGLILLETLFISMSAGCAASRSASTSQNTGQPAVDQFGAMRDVMREGHTESRIGLTDAVAQPHAVAVGALEGLAGEITIVDGDVWVSRPTDRGLKVTGPEPIAEDQATLLTLAHVATWQTVTIETAAEGRELELLIEQTAQARGINTTKPFPFVIKGKLTMWTCTSSTGIAPSRQTPQPSTLNHGAGRTRNRLMCSSLGSTRQMPPA